MNTSFYRLRALEEKKIAERVAKAKAQMDIEEQAAEEERRNPKFFAFAKSTRDFAWSRAKAKERGYDMTPPVKDWVVDTVRGTEEEQDKWFLSSAHAAAYCPRKFFQPTTAILGQGFHKVKERRSRPCFRIGCKPRREVGRGKRMVSGVAKVDDLRGIYELYRSGKGGSWDSNSGEGEGVKLFFTVVSEIRPESRYAKKMVRGDCFRLDLCIDDLYRCCRDTDYIETAMMGDDEFLAQEKASQGDTLKALKQQEAGALNTCQEELAKAKKLAAKVRLARKEKAESEFRKVKAYVRKEREKMRTVISEYVEAAEAAWKDVALATMKQCDWYEVSDDSRDMMYVNGKLENNVVGLPCIIGEKVIKGTLNLAEGEEAPTTHYELKLNCKVYQSVHKIKSKSKYRDGYRTLFFTVSQERLRLRFIAYDFETSDYFVFSYSDLEQEETVKIMREISQAEVAFQFQNAILSATYEDDGTYVGSKKRKFLVRFEKELEGSAIDVHMSEAEEKRAAANLDDFLRASSSRAQSRQQAGAAKLREEEDEQWGVEYED